VPREIHAHEERSVFHWSRSGRSYWGGIYFVVIPSGLNLYPVAPEDGTGVSKKTSTANLFREKRLTDFLRYEE